MLQNIFVSLSGQDSGPGTEQLPWRSLTFYTAQLNYGDILTLRSGVYRLLDEPDFNIINKPQLTTIQGYADGVVQLLGSASAESATWHSYNTNVWRIAADFLVNDPKGMFNNYVRVDQCGSY